MAITEPARKWQDRQHRRIVRREPTAFAELCEVALPHLVSFLEARFPLQAGHTRETIAIDLLLDYQQRPQQYDARRLSLFAYLRMAARGDMLNEVAKQGRREQRLEALDAPGVELAMGGGNTLQRAFELDDWLGEHTEMSFRDILLALQAQLDAVDEQVLLLMLEGVRETAAYAEVMNISHLDEIAQQREVKRTKDRIGKQLRRFGRRVSRP